LRIGAFNIQVFGKSKAAKPEVMDVLAKIIRTYDVVAIQEIRDKDQTALPKLVNLVNSKGAHYDYVVGPRLGRSRSKEQYAYIYNNQTVNLNGTPWTYPEPNGTDPFHREPYIAYFSAVNGSFDVVLITCHVDPDEATEEIDALDAVVNYTRERHPTEDDIIIMGDLNADCSYFDEDSNCSICGDNYHGCINNSIDTTTSATNCTYDRIIITSPAVPDYTGDSGVFRYDLVYNLTEEETKAVSDHYPIYAVFYCDGDIDTPEKGGSISVTSTPSGATIYVDTYLGWSYKGKTPLTITEVSPGDHTIKLTLESYYDWSTSVNAKTGEISYVHATLTPIPTTGTIFVHSSPSGATISLDDIFGFVTTPCTFTNVPPGHYKFELSLEGYYDWSTSVNANKCNFGKNPRRYRRNTNTSNSANAHSNSYCI
jgi:endonuclease/exonuclease/phosphatase family metal-dependent hydrolase